MSTYSKNEKICATCIYWIGRREVEFGFVETKKFEGKCGSEEAFYNLKTMQQCSCSCWRGFPSEK